jgi:hypothetical protein
LKVGVAALGAVAMLTAGPAGTAEGATPTPTAAQASPSLLFVHEVDGGRLVRGQGSRYRLRLRGVSPVVSSFTDRPARRAGQQPLGRFVDSWPAYGFSTDPPNAALVLHGAPASRDIAMLTLSHPRLDRRRGILTYRARPLRGRVGDGLAGFARKRDRLRGRRFGAASLFIDGAGTASIYQSVTLQFNDLQPGQNVSVDLTPTGPDVAWSTGPPFDRAGGIEVAPQSGVLPLSQLSVTGDTLTVQTTAAGGGGGGLTFAVSLYLVAEAGIDTFYLKSVSDFGLEVTAQLGGGEPQIVNQTRTLFAWDPQ